MHRVVVNEERHADNVDGHLSGHDQQYTNGLVLRLRRVKNVIFRVYLNKLHIHLEVQLGEVGVAFRQEQSLLELVLISAYLLVNLVNKIFEVERRKVDC